MNRARVLVVAMALAAPWLVAAPAGAAGGTAEGCEVPPDFADYNPVIGTDGDDVLIGTQGSDFICGGLGDDVIQGLGGDDAIAGDTVTFFGNPQAPGGDDRINGGPGNDEILSGPGDDKVNGGPGDDFLALAVGDDVGNGGPGNDAVQGGFGTDRLSGGPGDDVLAGGPGNDRISAGPGDDLLFGDLGAPPPDGAPVPPAGTDDRCDGGAGTDGARDCERTSGVEGSIPV